MARAHDVRGLMDKNFSELAFTGQWLEAMGKPESNFSAIIYGDPKNGKTEFCVMFAKYLTRYGRVLYNSIEQGISKSLQDAFKRQSMMEVAGKLIVTHKETVDDMITRLRKKKSPNIIFIDSLQYSKMSAEKFQELKTKFPKKVFIVISHATGNLPKGTAAQGIQYDVCMSIFVRGFKAECASRYGGSGDILIWEEGHQRWLARQRAKSPTQTTPAPSSQLTLIPAETKEAI